MPPVRLATAVCLTAALALVPAGAYAQNATSFSADLVNNFTLHSPVDIGGAPFSCVKQHCTSKASPRDPASVCHALAGVVGPLRTFTADGQQYKVPACTKVVPMTAAATTRATMAPAPKPVPATAPHTMVPATKMAPLPAPAAPPAPAPSSAGKKNATPAPPPARPPPPAPTPAPRPAPAAPAAPTGRINFTTPSYTITGTGVSGAVPVAAAIAFTTPAFTATGTGASGAVAAAAGIAFKTDTFRVKGSPP